MEVTLSLWIDNQPTNHDCTDAYIVAAGWAAPAGVTLDLGGRTISGPPDAVWAAYRSLAAAVALAGHGDGCRDMEAPRLTACPIELIEPRYVSAAEAAARRAAARLASQESSTWEDFCRAANFV